jgi:hypothetical protein
MLELIRRTRWDQAFDFLASGDPPMIFRLLALNTIFLIFYMLRRTKSTQPMPQTTILQVQAFLLLANFLILFQRDITQYLDRFI